MVKFLFSHALWLVLLSCGQTNSQAQKDGAPVEIKVGGPCEGCEAIYESKVPFDALNEIDTLPDFYEAGPKLVVSGTVYKSDGKTPAPGVVLYVYHTDQTGKYRVTGNETGWGKRHGSIRGWMKTNAQGRYKFYTLRPASYSKEGPPAHIHITIKEPGKTEYWIDDFILMMTPP
jgi:protocatechuate 3,4-dioxygenase beta subunit